MLFGIVKTVHIIGATILLGSGLTIAFFVLRSAFSQSVNVKLATAKSTVAADLYFTTPAVVLQPLSGVTLVMMAGYDPTETWLLLTYVLFAVAGACWLPVVWIQAQLRGLLRGAVDTGEPLPARYDRLFRIWFVLGWPAFFSVVAIIYLMVTKPTW